MVPSEWPSTVDAVRKATATNVADIAIAPRVLTNPHARMDQTVAKFATILTLRNTLLNPSHTSIRVIVSTPSMRLSIALRVVMATVTSTCNTVSTTSN